MSGHTHTQHAQDITEPILSASNDRLVLFPVKYADIYKLYKKQVASFWTPDELDLSRDKADWETLSADERHFLSHILAFFAASDGLVNENILGRFASDVQIPEARAAYAAQAFFESIHSETYSLLIDTLIADPSEKARLLNGVETVPAIQAKAGWVMRWLVSDRPFAERLVAFACVEGIAFSGAFCSIFWIKKRGILQGLTFSNELISRDEACHADLACALFAELKTKPLQDVVHAIVSSCVDLERAFICDALPCALVGMEAREMTAYIQFVADRLLVALGYDKLYKAVNPFAFMEQISLQGKTNFFERRVSEYAKSGVMSGGADFKFTVDDDF